MSCIATVVQVFRDNKWFRCKLPAQNGFYASPLYEFISQEAISNSFSIDIKCSKTVLDFRLMLFEHYYGNNKCKLSYENIILRHSSIEVFDATLLSSLPNKCYLHIGDGSYMLEIVISKNCIVC